MIESQWGPRCHIGKRDLHFDDKASCRRTLLEIFLLGGRLIKARDTLFRQTDRPFRLYLSLYLWEKFPGLDTGQV